MKKTGAIFYSLVAFLGLLPLGCTKNSSADRDLWALNALVERWNLAVRADTAEKGVELARGVLSDKGYVIVQSNRWTTDPARMSEALVGDRQAMCDLLAQSLRNGPKWGTIKVHLTLAGPIAYGIAEPANPIQEPTNSMTWFGVYAKEEAGWRIVFGTPADDFWQTWRQLEAGQQSKPEDAAEARAVRALMEQVNRAVNADSAEKGADLFRATLSDKGFIVVQSNRWATDPLKMSEALVGNKQALCEGLAQSLRDGKKWGAHQIQQLTIAGPIAYEIVEVKSPPDANGPTTWFNVLAREDVGWRIVFSTPAEDFQRAIRQLDPGKGKPQKPGTKPAAETVPASTTPAARASAAKEQDLKQLAKAFEAVKLDMTRNEVDQAVGTPGKLRGEAYDLKVAVGTGLTIEDGKVSASWSSGSGPESQIVAKIKLGMSESDARRELGTQPVTRCEIYRWGNDEYPFEVSFANDKAFRISRSYLP